MKYFLIILSLSTLIYGCVFFPKAIAPGYMADIKFEKGILLEAENVKLLHKLLIAAKFREVKLGWDQDNILYLKVLGNDSFVRVIFIKDKESLKTGVNRYSHIWVMNEKEGYSVPIRHEIDRVAARIVDELSSIVGIGNIIIEKERISTM